MYSRWILHSLKYTNVLQPAANTGECSYVWWAVILPSHSPIKQSRLLCCAAVRPLHFLFKFPRFSLPCFSHTAADVSDKFLILISQGEDPFKRSWWKLSSLVCPFHLFWPRWNFQGCKPENPICFWRFASRGETAFSFVLSLFSFLNFIPPVHFLCVILSFSYSILSHAFICSVWFDQLLHCAPHIHLLCVILSTPLHFFHTLTCCLILFYQFLYFVPHIYLLCVILTVPLLYPTHSAALFDSSLSALSLVPHIYLLC